jgi:hypothetical protein
LKAAWAVDHRAGRQHATATPAISILARFKTTSFVVDDAVQHETELGDIKAAEPGGEIFGAADT